MSSWSQRHAAYEALKALERPGGGWANTVVEQIGGQYGIGASTLRRWVAQGPPDRGVSSRYTPTMDDYVAVAENLTIKRAWEQRHASGAVPVAYKTYHRALAHGDTGLYEAALRGTDALINHRLYLKGTPLHRNHTWSYDHTELPIWVTRPRYKDAFKPWATIVTDTYSRALLAVVLIVGRPTAESVAAALTEAAVGRTYDGVFLGGLPVQMRFDNAAEHLGEVVAAGAMRMGIVAVPSAPYSKWENGHAESKLGLLQREALAGLPAVTMGGRTQDGKPRFDPGRDSWLSIDQLARHLDGFRDRWNTERTQEVLQNRTPMQMWAADDTDVLEIDEARMVANMAKKGAYQNVNKQGVNFRGKDYLPVNRNAWQGRKVWVRYLERNTDFIAISLDRDFNDFDFAYLSDRVPPEHRRLLLRERAAQRDFAEQVDAEATRRRAHENAVRTARIPGADLDDDESFDDEPFDDLVGSQAPDADDTGPSSDPDDDSDHDGADLDGTDVQVPPGRVTVMDTAVTSRRSRRRSPLPPAPATARQDERLTQRRSDLAAQQATRTGIRLPGAPSSPPSHTPDDSGDNS